MVKDTIEPEKDNKDKRGKIPLLLQVFEEKTVESKMKP